MIGVIFQFGSEYVEVIIRDNKVLFKTNQFGGAFVPIQGIKLSKQGVVKEFPDLKEREDWKKIAIERFNEKIKSMDTEIEKINYIMEDLSKFGYVPLYLQQQGHRVKKIKR